MRRVRVVSMARVGSTSIHWTLSRSGVPTSHTHVISKAIQPGKTVYLCPIRNFLERNMSAFFYYNTMSKMDIFGDPQLDQRVDLSVDDLSNLNVLTEKFENNFPHSQPILFLSKVFELFDFNQNDFDKHRGYALHRMSDGSVFIPFTEKGRDQVLEMVAFAFGVELKPLSHDAKLVVHPIAEAYANFKANAKLSSELLYNYEADNALFYQPARRSP